MKRNILETWVLMILILLIGVKDWVSETIPWRNK